MTGLCLPTTMPQGRGMADIGLWYASAQGSMLKIDDFQVNMKLAFRAASNSWVCFAPPNKRGFFPRKTEASLVASSDPRGEAGDRVHG